MYTFIKKRRVQGARAVIISGPNKGKIVTVGRADIDQTTEEVDALLSEIVAIANRIATTAQGATILAEDSLARLRASRQEINEFIQPAR